MSSYNSILGLPEENSPAKEPQTSSAPAPAPSSSDRERDPTPTSVAIPRDEPARPFRERFPSEDRMDDRYYPEEYDRRYRDYARRYPPRKNANEQSFFWRILSYLYENFLEVKGFFDAIGQEPDGTPDSNDVLLRAVFGEFLCTFIFLFCACAVVLNTDKEKDPSTVQGTVVTAFVGVATIYAFADVSGAHFNPAVTFATYCTKKTTFNKFILYILAQLLGSIFACIVLILCYTYDEFYKKIPITFPPPQALQRDELRGMIMEAFLTFMLTYVIFAVAFDTVDSDELKVVTRASKAQNARGMTIFTTSGKSKAGFAPIAIGFTLGYLSLLGGTVSGGAYNPARVFGPSLLSWQWGGHWIYWIGDLLGGALGGIMQTKLSTKAFKEQQAHIKATRKQRLERERAERDAIAKEAAAARRHSGSIYGAYAQFRDRMNHGVKH